ncbi:MAG: hypothetical protein ABJM58_07850 [Alteripontixanthobacter sp.]
MPDDELAKRRWGLLQLVRLGAALAVLLGIVIISGRLIAVPAIGYALLVAGAFGFFALPVMLAKKWKSPPQ